MIQKNELMLENWVRVSDGSLWIVKSISDKGIGGFCFGFTINDDSIIIPYDKLIPIPLTKEILLKNDFQEMNIEDFEFPDREELEELYLLVTEGIGELWVGVSEGQFYFCTECNICNRITYCGTHINGVHSVQNRYFSLFGMELNIVP